MGAAGNVTIVAGDNVTVHGADVSAGGDLKVTGRNVLLDAGQDAERSHQTESSSQYGQTLAMSGYAVSIAQSVEQAGRAVEQHKDPRVAALYLAQAALMGVNAVQSGAHLGKDIKNAMAGADAKIPQTQTQAQSAPTAFIKATVSIGGGSSSSESNAGATLNQGSTLRAGQNVTITATGKDASGKVVDGDIVARGSSISGRNVSLDAARDITLESRQDNTHQDSKNSGSNASIGVGFGLGGSQNGFTLELAAGFNRAHADGDAVTHVNSAVTAADTLTLNAGRDANLRGAQASGNTVNATVGRNLNVESRQDTDNYASRSESGGAQVSLCIPPICYGSAVSGSANVAEGRTDSTYASVVHQSGIAAGTGGYNINVKGNTDLVGGVISSTADPSKNTLRTGTLTTRDVENHAAYSSEQSSISASYTSGNPLNPDGVPTPLQQGVSNLASNAVGNAQGPIAGNASGTTRSAISAGTVVITDNAGQQAKTGKDADATIAGLNRDTAHANDGAIGKIFDKEKVEERQEIARLQAQVVQQVAPLLYKQVGNFLEKQPTEVRVAVHALVGGLLSRAMGGEFAAGAIGAGAATLAVETFGKQLLAIDGLSEGDRKALVQLVGMAVSGVAAGAAGGSSAGVAAAVGTAQSAIQNNYLNHQQTDALKTALRQCHGNVACVQETIRQYTEIDAKQHDAATSCSDPKTCQTIANDARQHGDFSSAETRELCGGDPSCIDFTGNVTRWGLTDHSAAQRREFGTSIANAQERVKQALEADGVGPHSAELLSQFDPSDVASALGKTGQSAVSGIVGKSSGSGRSIDATTYQGEMLGTNGAQTASKTVWKGTGQERIDVENPAPGSRPGQIHYQDNQGNKYYYDPNTKMFFDQKSGESAPGGVQKLLRDDRFSKAIDKALYGYLGAKK
nr:hemagglutinin repeat-containing protein [Ralstonia solanacearum]